MCKELVRLSTQDVSKSIPITDSKIIADKLKLQHRSVLRLISKYENDFKEFGEVRFEITPVTLEKVYFVNEQQFTLLVTYFKNTDLIREYKKKFVKAFYLMKNELQARQETRHISTSIRKSLTDSINNNTDEGNFKTYAYSNYSKLIYKKLFGKTVKKLKEERGIPEKANLRDYLTIEELERVQEIESKIATYIEMKKELSDDKTIYEEIKQIIK